MTSYLRFAFAAVICLCLLGCPGKGEKSGDYIEELGKLTARFQIVDLSTGSVTAAGSVPDLATNPAYRQSKMVFRLVDQETLIGTANGSVGASQDPTRDRVAVGPVYLGVFEITQDQWQRIAGTTPWTALQPVSASDLRVGADRPAVGIHHALATSVLAAFSGTHSFTFRLPSEHEWEAACRAGSSSLFSWGDDLRTTAAGSRAWTWETSGGIRGALAVGSLSGNALGFHDMHGNVAELTANGNLRGGSWNTPTLMTRCAHIARIGPDVAHATVGMRLVYLP